MKLLAQHGFGNGQRIERGMADGVLDGAIFGAKDIAPTKLRAELEKLEAEHPESVRLFDPQFYAALIAAKTGARLGALSSGTSGESHPYFQSRRRRELERESQVVSDLEAVIGFQSELPVSAVVAPNIVIQRSLDSVEAAISKSFLRNTAAARDNVADGMAVYATLAISGTALSDKVELQNFVQEITELDEPPDGFYLLLEKPDTAIPSSLTEPDILSRWMFLNHALKLNGFEVINGYTDVLAPYLWAVGADAVATGWFNTLKTFSLKKFEPSLEFRRKPAARYTSKTLLKSIRVTELDLLRDSFGILNELPSDEYYSVENDSQPDTLAEALQNWDCVGAMRAMVEPGELSESLSRCGEALDIAEELYVQIENQGFTMRDRSGSEHIEMIREELSLFEELAELKS